jgi:hypothetical protein
MRSVNLNEAEFYGKVSTPTSNREAGPRDCRHCGSQLAGRYRGVRFIRERAVGCGPAHAATSAISGRRRRDRRLVPCEPARSARWPGFDARRALEQHMCEGRCGIHGDPGQSSAHAIGERAGKRAAQQGRRMTTPEPRRSHRAGAHARPFPFEGAGGVEAEPSAAR